MHKHSSPDTNVPDQLSFSVNWFCAYMADTSIQPTFPFSQLPFVNPRPAEHLQLCMSGMYLLLVCSSGLSETRAML